MGRRQLNGSKPSGVPGKRGAKEQARARGVRLPEVLGNSVVSRLLGGESVQAKLRVGPPGDRYEREADQAAEAVVRQTNPGAGMPVESAEQGAEIVRRAPKASTVSAEEPATDVSTKASPAAVPEAKATAAPALLVDDDAPGASPGQMRKSDFLAEVRQAVCATADEGLATSGQSSDGCPWIQYWLGYYAGKDAAHVERALLKFAPEAPGASSARDYIPIVAQRVRRGVDRYAQTGEISEMPAEVPGAGMIGGFGEISFKAQEGGAKGGQDPASVRGQLGPGQPLEGGVRSQMESAFGVNFSRVRLHTGNRVESLSDDFNARAFTVGEHVAFAQGEYQPGTVAGQALLAHELAHVVQQSGAEQTAARKARGPSEDEKTLEADADASAVNAMTGLLGGARTSALPAIRSGLGLSRCSSSKTKPVEAPKTQADAKKAVEQAQAGQAPDASAATAACPADPAVAAAKAGVIRTFRFDAVGEDQGCCWTVAELNQVSQILGMVPENQRGDLAGLSLWRVKEPTVNTEQQASAAYHPLIVNGQRRDRLEIGDRTFTLAGQRQEGGGVTFRGDPNESRNTALHEVGHAIEGAPERLQQVEGVKLRFKAPGADESTIDTSRRMAEFVALVVLHNIEVKANLNIRIYVKNNWPQAPGELFADLYRISLTDPQDLKTQFGDDFVKFFTAPVGPKAPMNTQVDAWINAHRVRP